MYHILTFTLYWVVLNTKSSPGEKDFGFNFLKLGDINWFLTLRIAKFDIQLY